MNHNKLCNLRKRGTCHVFSLNREEDVEDDLIIKPLELKRLKCKCNLELHIWG
jgi:hypothetical protein